MSSASINAMTGNRRQTLGRLGEQLAATHLEREGWRIVERNYRTREGEIDLIAARRGTLAFCEVKTLVARRAPPVSGPANPIECVGPAKRGKVRRMARAWLAQHPPDARVRHRWLRLDVIGVLLAPDGTLLRLDHLESAF
jgi:putative endonuclease